jgi:CRP/FNR family transcriptional regulator
VRKISITQKTFLEETLLQNHPYFSSLNQDCESTLNKLVKLAFMKHYVAGEVLFLEGDLCQGLYLVEQGWVKSLKSSLAGREQVVRVVGPGEAFNEICVLIESSTNLVTVLALEPVKVWIVRRDAILVLMKECPRLAQTITQHLAGRVQHLMVLVEDLSLRSVRGRLTRFLLRHSHEGRVIRQRWATQSELAARLGTVPDVVNRVLNDLADEKLIEVNRHQISILDYQRLETMEESG